MNGELFITKLLRFGKQSLRIQFSCMTQNNTYGTTYYGHPKETVSSIQIAHPLSHDFLKISV